MKKFISFIALCSFMPISNLYSNPLDFEQITEKVKKQLKTKLGQAPQEIFSECSKKDQLIQICNMLQHLLQKQCDDCGNYDNNQSLQIKRIVHKYKYPSMIGDTFFIEEKKGIKIILQEKESNFCQKEYVIIAKYVIPIILNEHGYFIGSTSIKVYDTGFTLEVGIE